MRRRSDRVFASVRPNSEPWGAQVGWEPGCRNAKTPRLAALLRPARTAAPSNPHCLAVKGPHTHKSAALGRPCGPWPGRPPHSHPQCAGGDGRAGAARPHPLGASWRRRPPPATGSTPAPPRPSTASAGACSTSGVSPGPSDSAAAEPARRRARARPQDPRALSRRPTEGRDAEGRDSGPARTPGVRRPGDLLRGLLHHHFPWASAVAPAVRTFEGRQSWGEGQEVIKPDGVPTAPGRRCGAAASGTHTDV